MKITIFVQKHSWILITLGVIISFAWLAGGIYVLVRYVKWIWGE